MSEGRELLVTVLGGSGFVGRHVTRALARRGHRVRVAVRRPHLANFLQPAGVVGQIVCVQANVRDAASVARAVAGADAVVDCVGILAESGAQTFSAVHDDGARVVAAAAVAAGARRLVKISAIGADPAATSAYAASKANGEVFAHAAFADAVILRPSVIFGPEDSFLNRFAALARVSPFLPLIGGGETRFQPVFVGDVAAAVVAGVEGAVAGTVLELGGPEVLDFRAILEFVLEVTGRRRLLVPLPFAVASILGQVLEMLPFAPLTADQVELLRHDNVVSDAASAEGRTLQGLGIQPESMRVLAPTYLWRFRKAGQFERARTG